MSGAKQHADTNESSMFFFAQRSVADPGFEFIFVRYSLYVKLLWVVSAPNLVVP